MSRKPLGKRVRFEVFKRDGFLCVYCGAHPPAVLLEVDHVIPVAGGGGDEIDNLVTSCQPCNAGKSAVPLSVVPKSMEEKAAEVKEREAQLMAYSEIFEARRQRLDDDVWRVIGELFGEKIESISKADYRSIERFVELIGVDECLEAVKASERSRAAKSPWRYFCAVCWAKAREQGGLRPTVAPAVVSNVAELRPTEIRRPEGVSEQTWADWTALRKAKRAPVNATTIRGAEEEAQKAGMTLESFLRVWCLRGSQGLQAAWLSPAERTSADRSAAVHKLLGFDE